VADGTTRVEQRVVERIGGFCAYLRRQGVSLGMGGEVDFGRALGTLRGFDRAAWRCAAEITLAKSPEETAKVRAAFDLYFSEAGGTVDAFGPGGETRALGRNPRAPNAGRTEPVGARRESATPVAVPIGTYSVTAPVVPHSIVPVSERERRALRRGARRFRRTVATLPGRRYARAVHGRVELSDTVRHAVHHGGEWLELRRLRPRRTRSEIVVLWDVSGSMREHESRFFALVSALESVSRSGRIFAFSTRVEEITDLVRRSGYRRAVAVVGARIDRADGGTRIGRSLEEFVQRYGALLRKSTSLVILSDGWDLGEGVMVAEQLRRIRPRVARISWVTPYTRRPGFEPRVGALQESLAYLDELLGPEDFESRWPLRPLPR
jgi:uncharacterized protein